MLETPNILDCTPFPESNFSEGHLMSIVRFFVAPLLIMLTASFSYPLTIATVPVGDPGNPADLRYDASGVGSVAYPFRMGTLEVTNSQYAEFLNSAAVSDPYGLFDADSVFGSWIGIVRTGEPGSFTYAVRAPEIGQGLGGSDYNYGDKPVVGVSWFDTLRFVNWLHNGQGNGDTETGAYILLGGTPIPSNWQSIARSSSAKWWLPNETEWYKAAYFDPALATYYNYPIGDENVLDNNSPLSDTGHSANYLTGATQNANYPMTDVGSYMLSSSPFGTFDQGGNVKEWTEDMIGNLDHRLVRGGSWRIAGGSLHASFRDSHFPTVQFHWLGFRVATITPEPSVFMLSVIAGMSLALWRRKL